MKKTFFLAVLLAVTTAAMAQNVMDVDLGTLLQTRRDNNARAHQLYHGMTIQTSGIVRLIDINFLTIEPPSAGFFTLPLYVYFNSSERSKVTNLNVGQRITVRGVFENGSIMAIVNRAVINPPSQQTQQQTPQQHQSLNVVMYVTPTAGLRQRSAPSINSARLGLYDFRQRVVVVERGPRDTIDGITNYWYRTSDGYWVFGGYLSERYP